MPNVHDEFFFFVVKKWFKLKGSFNGEFKLIFGPLEA